MAAGTAKLTEIQVAAASAALDGDAATLYHLVTDLLGKGMPFESALFDVIAPVQRSLGERWLNGDYLISEEHVATSTIDTVVALLGGTFEQPDDAPRVVIACVEGEAHALPGRMLAAHLVSEGFRTVHLGASMPAEDLEQFLIEDPPDFLVLTCTMTGNLFGALKSIEAGHAAGVAVLIGGPALGESAERATRLGADAWAPRLRDVAERLRTVEPTRQGPNATAGRLSDDLAGIVAARPVLIGEAAALLAGGPDRAASVQEVLGLAFDALVAAMTVGENGVLVELADWIAHFGERRSGSAPSASRTLAALRQALGDRFSEAGDRLDAVIDQISR